MVIKDLDGNAGGDQFNKFQLKGISLKKCQLYISLFKVTKHCTQ